LTASGKDTYDIPLDKNIPMIYAFNPKDGSLSFHEEHYGFFNIKLDSSTGDCKKLNT
jgi:hypothetical protein